MKKKTTIKTISLKATETKPTLVKAKRVTKPDISLQAEIDEAIKEMETTDKEHVLLQRELEKPMKLRNKAILKKYNYQDWTQIKDIYPDLNAGINYEMEIHFPEDDGVKLEDRPKPWYVGLGIEHLGNKFNYRFPIHTSTYHNGQNLYKLDGFAVYVDTDGVIKNDISDYTIFQALTDYASGQLRGGMVNNLFVKYKVIKEDDVDADILDDAVRKNFAIKAQVSVTSKVIKGKEAKINNTVTSGELLLQSFTIPDGDADIAGEASIMRKAGGMFVHGLTEKLPDGVLQFIELDSISSAKASTARFVFLGNDPASPKTLQAKVVIGPSLALSTAKSLNSKVTKVTLLDWLAENNKKAYEVYSKAIQGEQEEKNKKATAEKLAKEEAEKQAALAAEKKAQKQEAKERKERLKAERDAEAKAAKEAAAAEKAAKEAAIKRTDVNKAKEMLSQGIAQRFTVSASDEIESADESEVEEMEAYIERWKKAANARKTIVIPGITQKAHTMLDVYNMFLLSSDNLPSGYGIPVLDEESDDDGNMKLSIVMFSGLKALQEYRDTTKKKTTSMVKLAEMVITNNKKLWDKYDP